EPRLVDAQARVGHEAVAVEPLDIVALVGGAVAPDVDVILLHGAHEQGAGDGAAVEGAALQGDETLFYQRAAGIHDPGDLGTVGLGAVGDGLDVGLVVLPDVCRVAARDGALFAHPGDRAGGVEPPGERDTDSLADGKLAQDLGHAYNPRTSRTRLESLS